MHRHRYVLGGTRIILSRLAESTDAECGKGSFGRGSWGAPHPLWEISQEGGWVLGCGCCGAGRAGRGNEPTRQAAGANGQRRSEPVKLP